MHLKFTILSYHAEAALTRYVRAPLPAICLLIKTLVTPSPSIIYTNRIRICSL